MDPRVLSKRSPFYFPEKKQGPFPLFFFFFPPPYGTHLNANVLGWKGKQGETGVPFPIFSLFRKTFRIHFLRTTISVLAFSLFPAKQSIKASTAHYQRISSILDLLYLLYHLPKKTCNSQNQKAPLSACLYHYYKSLQANRT